MEVQHKNADSISSLVNRRFLCRFDSLFGDLKGASSIQNKHVGRLVRHGGHDDSRRSGVVTDVEPQERPSCFLQTTYPSATPGSTGLVKVVRRDPFEHDIKVGSTQVLFIKRRQGCQSSRLLKEGNRRVGQWWETLKESFETEREASAGLKLESHSAKELSTNPSTRIECSSIEERKRKPRRGFRVDGRVRRKWAVFGKAVGKEILSALQEGSVTIPAQAEKILGQKRSLSDLVSGIIVNNLREKRRGLCLEGVEQRKANKAQRMEERDNGSPKGEKLSRAFTPALVQDMSGLATELTELQQKQKRREDGTDDDCTEVIMEPLSAHRNFAASNDAQFVLPGAELHSLRSSRTFGNTKKAMGAEGLQRGGLLVSVDKEEDYQVNRGRRCHGIFPGL